MRAVILLLGVISFRGSAAFDYCTISAQNTLCLYSSCMFSKNCNQPTPITITAAEKTLIVDLHNYARRKVAKGLETLGNPGPQPGASNMRQLIWDDELAKMAQAWVNQCLFQHDPNRDVSRFKVGQNLYASWSSVKTTTVNWQEAINSTATGWYGEVKDMTAAFVNSFPSSPPAVIGHYTQEVWAQTYTVGCAASSFVSTDPNFVAFPYEILVACNYGPTGNYVTQPVYQTGAAASACPAGTTPNDGLCA